MSASFIYPKLSAPSLKGIGTNKDFRKDINVSISTSTLEKILEADGVCLEHLRFHDSNSKDAARKALLNILKKQ